MRGDSLWTELPLAECMAVVIDYRGKTPPKTAFGVPLVTAKVIKGGRIETPNEFIAEADYDAWMRRGLPEAGDVVMTTEAPLGEVAQLDGNRVALAQRVIALRGKPGLLDNTFLKFMMQSEFVQDQLRARASGTTVLGIKQSELRCVTLKVPPLAQQRAIAHILGTLDDKIELNRRTNETLEQTARAIFKSWFVDFDPVRVKKERRQPPSMDAKTAALFPDDFDDSELGKIPKGWTAKPIGDAVNVVGGGTPSTKKAEFWEGGTVPWTTPKDLAGTRSPVLLDTERKITESGLRKITSGLLPAGTFLLSSRAPVGYTAISVVPIAVNQGYIAIPPGGELSSYYLLFWCRQNLDEIQRRAGGTTFQEISKRNFRPLPILLPDRCVREAFDRFVNPLFDRIVTAEKESTALAEARDALLPRLLSEELSVLQAKRAMEATV